MIKASRPERDLDGSTQAASPSQLQGVIAKMQQILLDGLRHGFFEFSVSGEAIKQDKLRVVIKAGNSYVFVVSPEDLNSCPD
jgi:hypothetical protein